MRKWILLLVPVLVLSLLVPAHAGPKMKYVPFLDRYVPADVLNMEVVAMDSSFEQFGVPAAREMFGVTGKGVKVCVVDTGIDPTHEQIAPRNIRFFDAINGFAEPYDDHGHGTHVAAIVAGDGVGEYGPTSESFEYRGVAPKAKLFAAKVLASNGSGTLEQVLSGIQWCAERPKVDIITLSIGTRIPWSPVEYGPDIMAEALDRSVVEYGKVVTVAAGNLGDAGGSISSPGSSTQAITVGAFADWTPTWPPEENADYSSGPYVAPFSGRGGQVDRPGAPYLEKPDVVAPGTTITSAAAGTVNGYVTMSGTSMATPFIAGVAALIIEQNPSITPPQVKEILHQTAIDAGPPGWDADYGWGIVDAQGALGGPPVDFFPHETVTGSVGIGETWSYDFTVNDASVPVSATAIVQNGGLVGGSGDVPNPDDPWLDPWFWSPPIEMWLTYPDDTVIRYVECPVGVVDRFRSLMCRSQVVGWNTPGHPPVSGVYTVSVVVDPMWMVIHDRADFTVDIWHG